MRKSLDPHNFGARSKQLFLKKLMVLLVSASFCVGVEAGEIKLYAAASLTDVLSELSNAYQKLHTNVEIKKSFTGSATLARQIENGAPADIFISADADWIDYVKKRGLLDEESNKKLLTNDLVLIAPVASSVVILLDPAFDLDTAFKGRICTGDPTSVPVGKYAKQSLKFYNWWNRVEPRLVVTEDVRNALAFVERAECGLGIVYKTDALLSKKVKIVATFPSTSHKPIEYSGAMTKNAESDAKNFWIFLQSKDAKLVFARYGFNPI